MILNFRQEWIFTWPDLQQIAPMKSGFIQQKILRIEVSPEPTTPPLYNISQPVQCGWLCQVKRQYVRQNAERNIADVVILMRGFVITAFIPVSALAPTITSSSIP